MTELSNFIRKKHTVSWDAQHKFICTPPTYQTVLAFVDRFATKIYGVHEASKRDPSMTTRETLVTFFAAEELIGEVLETCVELHGGCPGDVIDCCKAHPLLIIKLMNGVLATCNIDNIIKAMDLKVAFEPKERDPMEFGADAPPVQMYGIKDLSFEYKVPPHVIMEEWPFEQIVALSQLLPQDRKDIEPIATLAQINSMVN